jgi:DNA repair exonuclease SbcCD ATPase subunit
MFWIKTKKDRKIKELEAKIKYLENEIENYKKLIGHPYDDSKVQLILKQVTDNDALIIEQQHRLDIVSGEYQTLSAMIQPLRERAQKYDEIMLIIKKAFAGK